jgi:hypothetical protein
VDAVEILVWWVPPAVATALAMVWASWAGRPRRGGADRSETAQRRLAEAVAREHPGVRRTRPPVVRDRSTGIAVRPSRNGAAARPGGSTPTRRPA